MPPDGIGPGGDRKTLVPSRQLILDLARDPGFEAEDFLVSPANADAFGLIDFWPRWPSSMLVLVGPPGSGKSHLAAIWARRAGARRFDRHTSIEPAEVAKCPALLLEDCDRSDRAESTLFHLINLVRETGGSLILTARTSPDEWGVATPDLLSRLRLATLVQIERPDAALMKGVLVKLFADRQIRIEEDIVSYAALHLDQSLDAVLRFVQAVDDAALANGRRITKPLAAATILNLQDSDERADTP